MLELEEVPPALAPHTAALAAELAVDFAREPRPVLFEWCATLLERAQEAEAAALVAVTAAAAVGEDLSGSYDDQDAAADDDDDDDDGSAAPPPAGRGIQWAPAAPADPVPPLHHGEPFTDRRSTFQAHVARVTSLAEVRGMRAALLADGKIARATHNIVAYRLELAPGQFLQDCDDDGETAAGGRLLHLLQVRACLARPTPPPMRVRPTTRAAPPRLCSRQLTHTVNACVVVSRWCGCACGHRRRR